MAEARNSGLRCEIRFAVLVCLFSISPRSVSAGMDDPARPPQTCRYVFLSGQSTVTQTGGYAGLHEVYPVRGGFLLTIDRSAGTASFDSVDAHSIGDTRFLPTADLNQLFHLTALAGAVVSDDIIEFRGQMENGEEIRLTLSLTAEGARLSGTRTTPHCDDCYEFSLEAVAVRKYGGGTGDPNAPYLICTAEQMNAIGADPNNWDKHFKLMADIDLAELGDKPFNIIGTDPNSPFRGTFDGNGHAISNLVHAAGKVQNIGLFGVVADPNAEIRNLRLIAPQIDYWATNVGAFVGHLLHGTLLNCHAEDVSIEGHSGNAGGLAGAVGSMRSGGQSASATIRNCSSSGRVAASFSGTAGGLVGDDWMGSFCDCFSVCQVSSTYRVGGLAGHTGGSSFVHCYASGDVIGESFVGGLIGYSFSGAIVNCYSAGRLSGRRNVGGLIGLDGGTHVQRCLWDAEISQRLNSAGPTGKTTAEMQDPNTFIAMGWDFVGESDGPSDIWARPAGGGYPILWWQFAELPEPPFAGGKGDSSDPYLIATAQQLNSIGHNPRFMSAHFRLVNDINVDGMHFYLISSDEYPYAGVFDGADFAIANFSCTVNEPANVGLFRVIIGSQAEVRNLGLLNPDVRASNAFNVGSLAGLLQQGVLRNCHVTGGHVAGGDRVGGLVGSNGRPDPETGHVPMQLVGCTASASVRGRLAVGGLTGTNGRRGFIADCHAAGNVSGQFQVGGLAGQSIAATIADCSSAGQVVGPRWIGGLVGLNTEAIVERSFSTAQVEGSKEIGGLVGANPGMITDCYCIGTVSGGQTVGGLVGCNGLVNSAGGFPGTISRCYAAGRVTGSADVEGLVGKHVLGSISASFWDIEASGLPARAGGLGKTTAQMQMASTFLDWGWDFVGEVQNGTEDIWWIREGQDYPRLSWEQDEQP